MVNAKTLLEGLFRAGFIIGVGYVFSEGAEYLSQIGTVPYLNEVMEKTSDLIWYGSLIFGIGYGSYHAFSNNKNYI
ncbi:MAG: hypothetical protein QXD48_03420 [Candidatus Aenigmatarchaeota archaeon]